MQKQKRIKNKKPKVIGLFAGCGGLDLGFKLAGCEIVYSNDFDKSVKETYEKNIGPIEIEDIGKVNKSKLPKADIILAGIPCQPFSNAGNRKSINDERGSAFEHVIEILKIQKPKIVLFENVRGFMSAKDNEGVNMPDRIKSELSRCGYNFYHKLLNASDYGVPQNRFRVVMLGIRKDIDKGFDFPTPQLEKSKLTVGSVLEKAYPKDEKPEVLGLSPQSQDILEYIPEGGSWKNVPTKKLPLRMVKIRKEMKKYHSPNFYRRFARNEIMGTITASATPENSGIVHSFKNRRYSVREIARFQTFPDSFKFTGVTTRQKYKMIGNAVPVNLAKTIASSILKQYFKK